VSDVQHEARTFFSLYSDGLITGDPIDDFVEAWHNSGDDENRSLPEYLGMTDDEHAVWLMSHGALPSIPAARRDRRPLSDVVAKYLRDQQRTRPADRPAIHALSHWLQRGRK
jgi:hypothetical protein